MTMDIPEINALEEGIYPAKVAKLEVKETEAGTFRVWTFEVKGASQPVTATSSMMTGPKSKTYKWLSALIGRKPTPGEKGIQVVGQLCQLHISVDEDTGYNKVEAVLPASGAPKVVGGPVEEDWPLEEPPAESEVAFR